MPIDAYVAIGDKKYLDKIMSRMAAGEDFDPFIMGNIGEGGTIDFDFDEDRSYEISVGAMDERLGLAPGNVSNHAWNRVHIKKGEILHKNFIMTQAWCDKDKEIRGIDPSSYNIQTMIFTDDYDDISVAGFGVDKRFYARTNSGGAFKYYVNYRTNLNGKKKGEYLENGAKTMIINNVQSERRIKRVCGTKSESLDVTIKSDGALGVKSYFGEIGGQIINCNESYNAHYPFTYAKRYDDAKTPDVELIMRHVDSHNNRFRTSCPVDELSKIHSAPVTYPEACLESVIVHTNVFEASPTATGVFPWGKLHKYSYRFDLTKPEEVEGKVPQTLLP